MTLTTDTAPALEGKTIAILGAGPSGLVSAKEALSNGLKPTIFEKEAQLGGVWNLETGAVWNTMHTNISKFTATFGDTSWPEDTEMFPSAQSMSAYLNGYADCWKIRKLIKFQSKVIKVVPVQQTSSAKEDEESNGHAGWTVHWTTEHNTIESKTFHGVMVATGIFQEPNIPEINGLNSFPGKVIHSREYKSGEELRSLRVLSIGGSFSGTEIAVDVSNFTKECYHAFRRPFWILKKYLQDPKHNNAQIPLDLLFYTRSFYSQQEEDNRRGSELNIQKNHEILFFCKDQQEFPELKVPEESFKAPVNTIVSDHYLDQVKNKSIVPIHSTISEIRGSTIIFNNGRSIDVDVIIFGTGFKPNSRYFPEHVLQKISYDPLDRLQPSYVLFNEVLHPELENLFFIGMCKGSYFAVMEQQARLAARVLSGKVELPSPQIMADELQTELKIRDENPKPQFPHNKYVLFADTLATLADSFPDLSKLQDDKVSLAESLKTPNAELSCLECKKPEIAKCFMASPVVPAHYNLVDNPMQTVSQMEFVVQVLKELQS